ncbi:MGMT family protein [Hyalangium rubrum]|uniref:MGMT family protein n=1 Tax=Hyalangium rubrum TaxID=3103134 RepID=A0ABU5GWI6_9BACT|nr:MGMT family protein [Hyalangium sp. s54d21]MDY7224922.1 MGMT family protein [Hyalangium sp. s54d21]
MQPQDERHYERIYQVISQVPKGKVATYGDVATIVGDGCEAATVGQALGALGPRSVQVPWQRVIGRRGDKGRVTTSGLHQRDKLEAEGVEFDDRGLVDLGKFRWTGPSEDWARSHGFQMLPKEEGAPAVPDSQLRLF